MSKEVGQFFLQLSQRDPEWENGLDSILEGTEDEGSAELVSQFWRCMNDVCEQIRSGSCTIDDVVAELKPASQGKVTRLLKKRLRPYFACAFIRNTEDEMHVQIQSLIDELWRQHVIRCNPVYSVKIEDYARLGITKEMAEEFSLTLSALVDHCISRLLSFEGMVGVIIYQTGISTDIAEYIARRIERDSDELRMNYLIKTLSRI